ncbi:PTR2-domain-containing protein [Neoconidiobolus thromboides FSU 785]|nr:PTR2-domain-containing protein [Neoconidiobolus thromboides FSU 785]
MDEKNNTTLDERELQLLEQERIINAELDAKIAAAHDKFPKAVYFILPNEFGERFCFYGIKNLMNLYLRTAYGFDAALAKSQVHLFNGLIYLFPLFGAAISDSFLGKYHTIIYLSAVYFIGNALLSIFSINNLIAPYGSYPIWTYLLPIVLIAMGTGGIKPCVSSHGGDQFLPTQTTLIDRFFSLFYISINVGSLISQIITPYLKERVNCFGQKCFFLAFGFPTLLFGLAVIIFIAGFKYYRIVPPVGEFLPYKALKTAIYAARRYFKASKQERIAKGHWLKFSEEIVGAEFVEETRLLGKVIVILSPIIFFWTLYDQKSTEWQNQYEKMNHMYFGFINLPTEASTVLNSILIILLVPTLTYVVYPFLERRNLRITILNRMVIGYALGIIAFILSTCLQYAVEANSSSLVKDDKGAAKACPNCLNGTIQFVQFFILSLGEAMLSPTGVQFAYTQVGRQMKASSTSIWLLTTAIGNYFVMALELGIRTVDSQIKMWIYIGIATFFWCIFVYLGRYWYVHKEDEDAARLVNNEVDQSIKA